MILERLRINEAIRYLGYGNHTPDNNILKLLKDSEKELLKVIKPKYVYKIFDILEIDMNNNIVTLLGCSMKLVGKDIVNHLTGCQRVVVMACTASNEVDKLLRITQVKDMTKAVVMDSLASASVEQICDNAQEEILSEIEDYYSTWRFSCGYGDFPIESQNMFIDVLDAPKRIGLNATTSHLLVPTKSVTAVFGLSKNKLEKKRLGCESCNMKEKCNFRKKGERCEF
ncbi:MAG: methionine synthase [Clostridiales bacterium]|nr:methionine synthase [Clostridiales bacterium]